MPISNPKDMERIILAKRVGKFLTAENTPEDREAVLTVARKLASDISQQVREVLAFELRVSPDLPSDLAEKIACDIEDVSSPFLEHTQALNDEQLIKLLPKLHDNAHITLARRNDLSPDLAHAIVTHAEEPAVTYVVRNVDLKLKDETFSKVVERFPTHQSLMDFLSKRGDLPLNVVNMIIDMVSENCRKELIKEYAIDDSVAKKMTETSSHDSLWTKVNTSTPQQIHGFVTDLKVQGLLNHKLVLEMAERGNRPFLESTAALFSGMTLAEVRTILTLKDPKAFVSLMNKSGIDSKTAPKYLAAAKKLNALFPEAE